VNPFENLCPGCFRPKSDDPVCPRCGYDEGRRRPPLALDHRTLLDGRYLIGRVLGKPGGFGVTYLARDTRLEVLAAVKEYLPRDLAARHRDGTSVVPHSDEDGELFRNGLDGFLEEARLLARFDHEYIVRVTDFFRQNGTGYLVMDYYDGVSLAEYMERKDRVFKQKIAVAVMTRILDGLREAHEKGVLHRDVKPRNIYLTRQGKPVLLDFGAARYFAGEATRSLSVVLTAGFAPYEQYHRRGEQGPWTDVYGCAATLYYMVTGRTPPEATDRRVRDDLVPPSEIVPGLSPEFDAAVMKGLAAEASHRPQSAREFQDMLAGLPKAKREGETESEKAPAPPPSVEKTEKPAVRTVHESVPETWMPRGSTVEEKPEDGEHSGVEARERGNETGREMPSSAPPVYVGYDHRKVEQRVRERFPEKFIENPKAGDIWKEPVTGMELVRVPGGRFRMGSPGSEKGRYSDEGPVHEVYVDGFWMGKYEVTQEQWERVMGSGSNPSRYKGRNHPVENVSWNDAHELVQKLNQREGSGKFRLPTEAEWEYACRAGSPGKYCFGDDERPLSRYAWYRGNSGGGTHPAGRLDPNDFGLYDMHGNVWEWCSDWYDPDYYGNSPRSNPRGPSSGSYRVLRGGGWYYSAGICRSAYRNLNSPDTRRNDYGFRLVLSPGR